MIVREMNVDDLDVVLKIEEDSYKSPWSKAMFLNELTDNKYAFLFVLEANGMIVGYYGFWAVDENAMITKVTIIKPLRGKGLGKILMEDLITRLNLLECDSVTLEVRVSNISAITLYEKYGFKIIGKRTEYYQDGEDAHVMLKKLNEGANIYEENYYRN
jgi:ribosomal-protein-alanine N-acetyltransferase